MAMHFGCNGWRVAVTGRRPRASRRSGAAQAIRNMERGHLDDIAHDSMELLWFVKRLMPETIYHLFAWMYANSKWKFKH